MIFRRHTLSAALSALCLLTSAFNQAQAQSCPAGAICRAEEPPGNYSGDGPYDTDSYTLPLSTGRPAAATVYFPTDAAPPYSVIVFTPPYLTTQIGYAAWGSWFASHGFVIAITDSATIYDYPDARARQQQQFLDIMVAENNRALSPVNGLLDTSRLGAMGWSMGGGATWITSGEYPVKTALSLAGHNLTATNSNASGANTYVPIALFNGATDTTYLGGLGQSEGVYNSIPSGVPKFFYNVSTAGHFDWGYPTQANRYVAELALAFQKAYLDGDTRWIAYIDQPPVSVAFWGAQDLGSASGGGETINGTFRMVPVHSGKAVDNAGCGTAAGANVQQWSWLNNDCQKWTIASVGNGSHRISPVNAPDLAFDIDSFSTADGGNLMLWSYTGAANQLFQFRGTGTPGQYQVVNNNSGKCLDVFELSTDDGANIVQWACIAGNLNQVFELIPQ